MCVRGNAGHKKQKDEKRTKVRNPVGGTNDALHSTFSQTANSARWSICFLFPPRTCFLSFVLMTTIRHSQNFRHLPCSIRSRRNATSTCKTKSLSGPFGPFRSVEGYGSQDVPRTVALPQAGNGYIARVPFRKSAGQSAVEECPI